MDFTQKEIEVRNSVVNTNNSINNTDVYQELILRKLLQLTANVAPYKVYTALLSQYGTDAPVVRNVLENTLGFTPIWIYDDLGTYLSNNAEWLTNNKVTTFINCGNFTTYPKFTAKINYSREYGNIIINSYNNNVSFNGILSDEDLLYLTTVEIRIYN